MSVALFFFVPCTDIEAGDRCAERHAVGGAGVMADNSHADRVDTVTKNPKATYGSLLEIRRRELKVAVFRDNLISNLRLVLFIALSSAAIAFIYTEFVSGLSLAMLSVGFLLLMAVHGKVLNRRKRLELSVSYYEKGLARVAGCWLGQGDEGLDFLDANHVFSSDLDLFGPGSVFELVSRAGTGVGRETLAHWFTHSASGEEIDRRQEAVRGLGPEVDFREELALTSANSQTKIHASQLLSWVGGIPILHLGKDGWVFGALFVAAIVGPLVWALGGLGPAMFLLVALVQWGVRLAYKPKVSRVLATVAGAQAELDEMGSVFEVAEVAAQKGQRNLSVWCDSFGHEADEALASKKLRALGGFVRQADAMKNQVFALLGAYLGWDHLMALRVEKWRLAHQQRLPVWIAALGELEALTSLSTFAFEHPGYVWPAMKNESVQFQAEALAHPLLPEAEAVGNDMVLNSSTPLLMVSGSNMSGKSTLLRTIGVNVVLATCGAPVRAKRMVMSPLHLGATLSVHDSLMGGASRFYAEISRIQALVKVSEGSETLLFLMDEILHGTNSLDRQKGARAILEFLVAAGSIGVVTTHDLALAKMVADWPDKATNMHFTDEICDRELVFDFLLRPGIVTRSNAIELMRSIGLPV